MFNLEKVRKESGLKPDILLQIEQKVREDFDDEMMFELHFIRAIDAIKQGRVTIEQLMEEETLV